MAEGAGSRQRRGDTSGRARIRTALEGGDVGLATKIAKFYLSLHEDWSWILRRVENIEYVDADHRERRTSIDIRIAEVRRRAEECEIDLEDFPELPIPLGMLRKTLLLDFDVRDSSGAAVSLFTSDHDSVLATFALVEVARDEGLFPKKKAIREALESLLFDAAKEFPDVDDIDNMYETGRPVAPRALAECDADVRGYWEALAENPRLAPLLSDFTVNFSPVVWFAVSGHVEILKYREIENERDSNQRSFLESRSRHAFGRTAKRIKPVFRVAFRVPNVARADRVHIRVHSPPGTFHSFDWLIPQAEYETSVSYMSRVTRRRMVFYTDTTLRRDYYVYGALHAELRGFWLPAFLLAASTTTVLVLAALVDLAPMGLLGPVGERADGVIALLLLMPSIFVGLLARNVDHDVRQRIIKMLKAGALSYTLVPLLLAALTLVAGLPVGMLGLVWLLLAVPPLYASVRLLIYRGWNRRIRRYVDNGSVRVKSRRVTVDFGALPESRGRLKWSIG